MTVAIVAPGLGRGVLVGAVLLSMALTGCQDGGGLAPRTTLGGLGGAAGGGLIAAAAGGSAPVIAASVILGGLVGGAIGERLDQRDRQLANQTANRAFETTPAGQAATWRNPDTGHSGSVTPTRTFQAANGGYCREFQQDIVVGGQTQQSFGTACRQPDGRWQIVG
jgi:surface antigen